MGILERPEHSAAVDKIITDLMPPEMLKRFSKEELEAIRTCVGFARDDGIASTGLTFKADGFSARSRPGYPTPLTELDKEIAKQAIEFESEQAPKFLARVDNQNYPWRWSYASMDDQKLFRDFCTRKKTETKNT